MKTTFIFALFLSLACVIGGSLGAMQGSAVKLALEAMPTPNDPALNQQLLAAAEQENLAQAQALVRSGADVNTKDSGGRTPLHWAAGHHSQVMLTNFLLDNKANINAQDNAGDTPLHVAAFEGYLPIVRLLLSRGADATKRNSTNETALGYARSQNHPAVAKLIQDYIISRSSAQPQPSPEAEFGINLE
jgi:ankyrin repeat protein